MTSDKFDILLETFKKSHIESLQKCASESERLRVLMVDAGHAYGKLIGYEKFRISLIDIRLFELLRLSINILYLVLNGLYRNAFDNIRYFFESTIQSVYIDSRHSNSSLRTRIEILKEVEDKREYRAINLIDELEINHKDTLKKEYKRLSHIIHPSHRTIMELLKFQEREIHELLIPVNCEEISDVFESMKILYDIVLFLYISCLPITRKEKLKENTDLAKFCSKYNLFLSSRVLKLKKVKKIG